MIGKSFLSSGVHGHTTSTGLRALVTRRSFVQRMGPFIRSSHSWSPVLLLQKVASEWVLRFNVERSKVARGWVNPTDYWAAVGKLTARRRR